MQPHTFRDAGLNCLLISRWTVQLDGQTEVGLTEHNSHHFQKEFQILINLTTEQFSILLQTIFDELWAREDGSISGSCSHMASSLSDAALTSSDGLHSERFCVQTVISKSVPIQCCPVERSV